MITALRSAVRRSALLAALMTLVAASLGLGLTGTASADATVYVYLPTAVPELTVVAGNASAAENQERLGRTGFLFTDDGRFAMVQPDGYPQLDGTWNSQDGTFRGVASSSTGYTGSTAVEVLGTISFGADGTATIRMTYTAGGVMAANVGGVGFGSSSSKAFHATVELEAR